MFLSEKYNRESFLAFISGFLPDFVKEEREFALDGEGIDGAASLLGRSKQLNLGILEFSLKPEDGGRRIAVAQNAFKVMRRHGIRNAVVAFSYGGDAEWRLSLLTTTLELGKSGKIMTVESNPHRYSYLVGPGAKTKTPHEFLIDKGPVADLADLMGRFSVEVVNKQFYASIAELFTELVGGTRGDGKRRYVGVLEMQGQEGPTEKKQSFAVRLIGRIVFCWFLKKKYSATGSPLISDDLLSGRAVRTYPNYYHEILEPLFFELLNKPLRKRIKFLQEEDLFRTVPYLNGGLFSPQVDDSYQLNQATGRGTPGVVMIPDEWFTKLFDVLSQYNFTVDENTSYDVDLSIDPEMLGRIFENLLAEVNPITGESARKNTGSFYTPREIVEYMVDTSLLYYLEDKAKVDKEKLQAIISYGREDDEQTPTTPQENRSVVDALDQLTILDPACGSGAFPIGVLQKVVYILQQVDPDGRIWFEKQIKNIPSVEMRRDLEAKFEDENYDYIRKLGVIRQSIFGVDIQSIATEIAKLRCFLTLVIEENVDDDKQNRGIHPLPNLDFKFVTANTLVGLTSDAANQTNLLEDRSQIEELARIRDSYFTASSEERMELKMEFIQLQRKMLIMYRDTLHQQVSTKYDKLMCWEPFDNEKTDWFSPRWMFGVDGFDIVIGNPPYVHLEDMKDEAARLYEPLGFATYVKRGDLYVLFIERGVNLLKTGGILTYITSNKWMRAEYGKKLRNYLTEKVHPVQLVDLGGGVFESATVDTDILVLKKENYSEPTQAVAASEGMSAKNIESYVAQNAVKIRFKKDDNWAILSPIEQSIKDKIEKYGVPLKDWDIRINYGIKTGCNEAFIIDEETRAKLVQEDPKSAEIIRPVLRGRDIKRYGYDWAGLYVILAIFGSHKYMETKYPAVYKHLLQFKDKLEKRGQCRYLSSGKVNNPDDPKYPGYPGMHHWLELDNNPSKEYMDDFDKQNIAWQRITRENTFCATNPGFVILDSMAYLADVKSHANYLLAVLNSKLIKFWIKKNVPEYGSTGFRLANQFLEVIPVPITIQGATQNKISRLVEDFQEKNNDEILTNIDKEILSIYNLTDEEKIFILKNV